MIARQCLRCLRLAVVLASGVPILAGVAAGQSVEERTSRMIAELGLHEAPEPVRQSPKWRKPERVIVRDLTPERRASLEAVAPGVELVAASSDAEARDGAANADAVLGSCAASIVEAGSRIRWVQTYNAGVERCLASPLIRERGILLTNMQRIAGPAMAEHVIALTLSFARGLPAYQDAQRDGRWARGSSGGPPAFTLGGKTMLVAGLGGVGSEVARRAHALGMTVVATRNSVRDTPPYVSRVGLPGDLMAFIRDADIVVNTLPLTQETRGTFDARVFAAMKRGAYFINVGRGATVVTSDLMQALQSGAIAGAGLDVVEPEPLPAGHPLWTMPNVIITPHVSADSDIEDEARWLLVRENLRRYVAGERMLSVVDPSRGY